MTPWPYKFGNLHMYDCTNFEPEKNNFSVIFVTGTILMSLVNCTRSRRCPDLANGKHGSFNISNLAQANIESEFLFQMKY